MVKVYPKEKENQQYLTLYLIMLKIGETYFKNMTILLNTLSMTSTKHQINELNLLKVNYKDTRTM